MNKAVVVIPARYNSKRLPGKPLMGINGTPMIERVWRQALKIKNIKRAMIATDDTRIAEVARSFGALVQMTKTKHKSGSDRVAEVTRAYPDETIILNLQGDLPYVCPEVCGSLIAALQEDPTLDIATPAISYKTRTYDFFNPNIVKVVFNANFKALLFTRSPVPYVALEGRATPWWRHIGVYAYRNKALQDLAVTPPSILESAEKLEQLRALDNGYSIKIVKTSNDCGPDINCWDDLRELVK